jgi:hypothetical protein
MNWYKANVIANLHTPQTEDEFADAQWRSDQRRKDTYVKPKAIPFGMHQDNEIPSLFVNKHQKQQVQKQVQQKKPVEPVQPVPQPVPAVVQKDKQPKKTPTNYPPPRNTYDWYKYHDELAEKGKKGTHARGQIDFTAPPTKQKIDELFQQGLTTNQIFNRLRGDNEAALIDYMVKTYRSQLSERAKKMYEMKIRPSAIGLQLGLPSKTVYDLLDAEEPSGRGMYKDVWNLKPKIRANNWYAMLKTAFPYGRIKCPKCRKTFANDFGFRDTSNGGPSTQDVMSGNLPFVDFEKKKYKEPIDGVSEDQVERGTITVECPSCQQWLEVEYEWNTGSPEVTRFNDYFSQVVVTDVQEISPEMANAYQGVGMTSGLGVEGV